MKLPKYIYHENLSTIAKAIYSEISNANDLADTTKWYTKTVILEFPLGELYDNYLKTTALVFNKQYKIAPIGENEKFNAQGLEGKVQVEMPLYEAINRMELLPEYRGRIVTR